MTLRFIFSVLVWGLFVAQLGQAQHLQFDDLTVEDGLASNWVLSIVQDHQGYMWFGTHDGLNRYDGYTLTTFTHNPSDSTSLASSYVESLLVDRNGTLWVGTFFGGLNRFDPDTETFTYYLPEDADLTYNAPPHALCEDKEGMIWMGMGGSGLYRFDPDTETFTHYVKDANSPHSIGSDFARAIYEDSRGTLWIGTGSPWTLGSEGGLRRYERETDTFTRFLPEPDRASTANDNHILSISEDRSGHLWVTTPKDGIYRFNRQTETFTPFLYDPDTPQALHSPRFPDHQNLNVTFIQEERSSPGVYWIGALEGGLNRYDSNTGKLTHFSANQKNIYSLAANTVWSYYEDQGGTLWIATWNGINKIGPTQRSFQQLVHDPSTSNSLSDNFVRAVYEDASGTLWVGTNRGLNKKQGAKSTFIQYFHDPARSNSLSHNMVTSIAQTNDGSFWIGTEHGLNKLDAQTGSFSRYVHDPDEPSSLSHSHIVTLLASDKNYLWVGTRDGLNRFAPTSDGSPQQASFTRYTHDPNDEQSISSKYIYSLYESPDGTLWVGTDNGGLNRLDPITQSVVRYPYGTSNPRSLSHARVNTIHQDGTGILWIGTDGGGLNKLITSATARRPQNTETPLPTERFFHFTEESGLPSNVIRALLSDEDETLWISTNKGLVRYNPQDEQFTTYDLTEGLRDDATDPGVIAQSHTGEMFLGGYHGLTSFFPDQIRDNRNRPPVVFTAFNRLGMNADTTYLATVPSEIVLPYARNMFTFEFAALDYADPSKNQYAYHLSSLSEDWVDLGMKRDVTFMHLNPGTYDLTVRGSNNRGFWNEEGASVRIIITPPFWQETWFRGLLMALVLGSFIGAYRWRTRTFEKQQQRLEKQVTERTQALNASNQALHTSNEALNASNALLEAKNTELERFTYTVSHDLKSPIFTIKGFLSLLQQDLNEGKTEQVPEYISYILSASDKMQRLLDELLELSRIGRLANPSEEVPLEELISDALSLVSGHIQERGIDVQVAPDLPTVYGDRVRLTEVFQNLLENAIKFMGDQEAPHIEIGFRSHDQETTCYVQDNGIGIDPKYQEKVFGLFDRLNPNTKGTGIGLTLVKRIVEVHGGRIWVESKGSDQGATFYFTLPHRENPELSANST